MLKMLQGEVGIARLIKYITAQPASNTDNSRPKHKIKPVADELTLITEQTEKDLEDDAPLAEQEIQWQVIRKLSHLVLLELLEGSQQNLNLFTQLYGCTYGNIQHDETNLDEPASKYQGVIILNADSLQSEGIADYLDAINMDFYDLIENLKDFRFIESHSVINENLNSFVFPNKENLKVHDYKLEQIRESGILPKIDKNMLELIMNMGDPA